MFEKNSARHNSMTNCVMHFLNMKKTKNRLRKVTHSFEVNSHESACRKNGRLRLEQVYGLMGHFSSVLDYYT